MWRPSGQYQVHLRAGVRWGEGQRRSGGRWGDRPCRPAPQGGRDGASGVSDGVAASAHVVISCNAWAHMLCGDNHHGGLSDRPGGYGMEVAKPYPPCARLRVRPRGLPLGRHAAHGRRRRRHQVNRQSTARHSGRPRRARRRRGPPARRQQYGCWRGQLSGSRGESHPPATRQRPGIRRNTYCHVAGQLVPL